MKIVLIGFMGTGKSSVAPRLAKRLDLEAVEMDDLIVKRAGGKSIRDIFAADGEAAFRELEAAVGKELRDRDQVVISTGGGVVMNQDLMASLVAGALVINLDAPFKTVLLRAGSGGKRPLLTSINQARTLYETRKPLYNKYATIHISTESKSVNKVVQAIIDEISKA